MVSSEQGKQHRQTAVNKKKQASKTREMTISQTHHKRSGVEEESGWSCSVARSRRRSQQQLKQNFVESFPTSAEKGIRCVPSVRSHDGVQSCTWFLRQNFLGTALNLGELVARLVPSRCNKNFNQFQSGCFSLYFLVTLPLNMHSSFLLGS